MGRSTFSALVMGILGCSYFPGSVSAQHFQNFIGGEMDGEIFYVETPVSTSDDGVIAQYTTEDSKSIIKTDQAGNILWRISYPLSFSTQAIYPNIIATNDGGAYLLEAADLAVIGPGGGCTVTRLAADGTVLWSQRYRVLDDEIYYPSMVAEVREDDGVDILLHGNPEYPVEIFLRLSSTGELNWAKHGPFNTGTSSFTNSNDGGVYMYGSVDQGDLGNGLYLRKLNVLGDQEWNLHIGMNNAAWDFTATSMVLGVDDEVYLLGRQSAINMRGNLLKVSSTGELLWYRTIIGDMGIFFGSHGRLTNSQIIFGGANRLKFDLNGSVLARESVVLPNEFLGNFEYQRFYSIYPDGDDLLVAGRKQRRDITFDYMWSNPVLMRVPEDLSNVCELTQTSITLTDTLVPWNLIDTVYNADVWVDHPVTITLSPHQLSPLEIPQVADLCLNVGVAVEEHHGAFDVFPSPVQTNSNFYVTMMDAGAIEIYDAIGQRVRRQQIKTSRQVISTTGLAAGIYMVRGVDQAKRQVGAARLLIE